MTVRIAPILAVVLLASLNRLSAQGVCAPGPDSHEAHTLAILSVPVTFTGAQAPAKAHGISVGLEAASIPTVDRTNATPTACQAGKGPDNTNPLPGFVRPRVAVAVHGFLLEAAWVPPVVVDQVKANLVGLAVARPIALPHEWMLGLRADAVLGNVHAPVTCDDDALQDASSKCYHGTRSDDKWQPGLYGFEGVLSTGQGRIKPYLGVGYTILRPQFDVHFTDANGFTDNTHIEVNLNRAALFAGATAPLGRLTVTAEAYSTPSDAIAGRVVVRTQVKP